MANILDYIKWRGDLNFEKDKYNSVDNLILSRLVYFPFEEVLKKEGEKYEENVTLKELSKRLKHLKKQGKTIPILWPGDDELLILAGDSKRYKDIYVTDFLNKLDKQKEKQFSAITFHLPNGTMYVAFRGTDNTLIGWKEDFNLSFKSHTTSQKESVGYLDVICKKFNKPMYIGGHSKGGNLAIYGAIYLDEEYKDRIIGIYNNDGPGFREDIIEDERYIEILNKVESYIPETSIIGRLLEHKEKTYILRSDQKGIMQHDLYSWEVLGNKFIYEKDVSKEALLIDKTIKDWLIAVDDEKREKVIDVIYNILVSTNKDTFKDIRSNIFANSKTIIQSYNELDTDTKQIIMAVIRQFLSVAKNNIIDDVITKKSKKLDDEKDIKKEK